MSGKDWPNLRRMFAALCFLLISPLLGIAVGAVCWGSLERGLLVFNLLGLMGFALATRPFWHGNRKRTRGLIRSALAAGVSALLDILSGRPIPFAVYFSSMVECFSLIPWIIEILQEIHQGRWRAGPVPPPPAPAGAVRRKTPPPRPELLYQGPEEPVPGFPRWGYLLLIPLLGLVLLLLLTSCHSPAEVTPSPGPTPIPTPSEAIPTPSESPETERALPALFAENERWMVYLDDWVTTKTDGSVMDLSVYEKDGTLYQKLRSISHSTGPHPWAYLKYDGRIAPPVLLTDLNFDGIDDIRVDYETIRHGAFAAFLWNEEEQRFIEEPTYTKISAAHPMNGLIFGHGSSGASSTYYSAYSYDPEAGYQLIRFLNIEILYLPDNEYQPLYTEWYYENGELTDTVETEEDLSQSDFWREYVEYCYEYVWG